jgi:predicted nucleic acid-binding protein
VSIESVVADANVLLSAVAGKAALRVLTDYLVDVHMTRFNFDEIVEYIPEMARKYRLSGEFLELQLKLLPIRVHEFGAYEHAYESALRDLAPRDPEDAHALALARHLGVPLWSNDRDLDGLDVQCFTTARLLSALARERDASE